MLGWGSAREMYNCTVYNVQKGCTIFGPQKFTGGEKRNSAQLQLREGLGFRDSLMVPFCTSFWEQNAQTRICLGIQEEYAKRPRCLSLRKGENSKLQLGPIMSLFIIIFLTGNIMLFLLRPLLTLGATGLTPGNTVVGEPL